MLEQLQKSVRFAPVRQRRIGLHYAGPIFWQCSRSAKKEKQELEKYEF